MSLWHTPTNVSLFFHDSWGLIGAVSWPISFFGTWNDAIKWVVCVCHHMHAPYAHTQTLFCCFDFGCYLSIMVLVIHYKWSLLSLAYCLLLLSSLLAQRSISLPGWSPREMHVLCAYVFILKSRREHSTHSFQNIVSHLKETETFLRSTTYQDQSLMPHNIRLAFSFCSFSEKLTWWDDDEREACRPLMMSLMMAGVEPRI